MACPYVGLTKRFSLPRVGQRPMETPSKVTSFPRKRESFEVGPRFRGGDAVWDFHLQGWVTGPWLLRMTAAPIGLGEG